MHCEFEHWYHVLPGAYPSRLAVIDSSGAYKFCSNVFVAGFVVGFVVGFMLGSALGSALGPPLGSIDKVGLIVGDEEGSRLGC